MQAIVLRHIRQHRLLSILAGKLRSAHFFFPKLSTLNKSPDKKRRKTNMMCSKKFKQIKPFINVF